MSLHYIMVAENWPPQHTMPDDSVTDFSFYSFGSAAEASAAKKAAVLMLYIGDHVKPYVRLVDVENLQQECEYLTDENLSYGIYSKDQFIDRIQQRFNNILQSLKQLAV